ncbi:MAG: metal ABC transporter permease [Thermoleophilia bacterium]
MSWLAEPFTLEFMQRALVASLIVALLCSVIGCFVVVRGMAFLGDALAHAILPGVAVAYLIDTSLLVGGLVAALLVAIGIGFVTRHANFKEDTAIGILFAAALALGVVLISTAGSYAVDLTHILFGNVLGVSKTDLWLTGGIAVGVLTLIVLFFKEFQLVSFDPVLAHMLDRHPELLRFLLLLLLALTIVVSLQTVGVGLVAAMLVTPAAAAYLLTRRLATMMLVSALLGCSASVVGLYVSYYLDVASGAAIVLTATVLFLVVFVAAPGRGLLARRLGRRAA